MAKEIEVRFLEIDKGDLVTKLIGLGAEDFGEGLSREFIFYDPELTWQKENRQFVRIRSLRGKNKLTMKTRTRDEMVSEELELEIEDPELMALILEKIGLLRYRVVEKYRHTLKFGEVTVDIDTWPKVPAWAEFEGPDPETLKTTTSQLGFAWEEAVTTDPKTLIEEKYKIPMGQMRWFTFDRFE